MTTTPDPIDIELGRTLRARRTAAGLSQTKLGDAVGITFQQIQKYEKGTNRVSGSRLAKIAAALGCAPADLLGGEGAPAIPFFASDVLRLAKRLQDLPPAQRDHTVAALDRIVSAMGVSETIVGVALKEEA